jgi:hypothetical protein
MIKKKQPELIKFKSLFDGLELVDELKPTLLIDDMPKWFKDMPMTAGPVNYSTAKRCPSFIDLFRVAYVVKAWTDMRFTFFPNKDGWTWEIPNDIFVVNGSHPEWQFLDWVPTKQFRQIIKPDSPWILETPKGVSTLQIPYPFDFNNDFTIWPGIIHTDTHHETNMQLFIYDKTPGEEFQVTINRGQPLGMYIPFRREQWGMEVSDGGETLRKKSNIISKTKWKNSYRNMTKGFIK